MGDVARAKTHHDIAGLPEAFDDARKLLRAVERNNLPMPVRTQTLHQRVAVGAGNITQWAYALPGELAALGAVA